ncbi:hypothetical protein KM043_004416 [Ampulex compressa]|nr:hypothetical protein KM043_004416 [Ampulex compressa]
MKSGMVRSRDPQVTREGLALATRAGRLVGGAECTSRQLAVRGRRRGGGNRDNEVRGNQLSAMASGRPPTQLFPNCANVRAHALFESGHPRSGCEELSGQF